MLSLNLKPPVKNLRGWWCGFALFLMGIFWIFMQEPQSQLLQIPQSEPPVLTPALSGLIDFLSELPQQLALYPDIEITEIGGDSQYFQLAGTMIETRLEDIEIWLKHFETLHTVRLIERDQQDGREHWIFAIDLRTNSHNECVDQQTTVMNLPIQNQQERGGILTMVLQGEYEELKKAFSVLSCQTSLKLTSMHIRPFSTQLEMELEFLRFIPDEAVRSNFIN